MASIDKIYGSCDDWVELYQFLKKNKPKYLVHLYDCPPAYPRSRAMEYPISNFPEEADKWLYKNCSIDFVQRSIRSQYSRDYLGLWNRNLKKKIGNKEKANERD